MKFTIIIIISAKKFIVFKNFVITMTSTETTQENHINLILIFLGLKKKEM